MLSLPAVSLTWRKDTDRSEESEASSETIPMQLAMWVSESKGFVFFLYIHLQID